MIQESKEAASEVTRLGNMLVLHRVRGDSTSGQAPWDPLEASCDNHGVCILSKREVVSLLDLGTCMTSVCRGKLIVIFGTIIECLLYTKHCIVFYWLQHGLILMSPQEMGVSPFYRWGS